MLNERYVGDETGAVGDQRAKSGYVELSRSIDAYVYTTPESNIR